MFRIGFGYDIHPLAAGRRFILGGIEIPFPEGPAGHSDGDGLVHAVIDSLLGAMGEGDIGLHFPDTDPRYKDVSSLELLREVMARLKSNGWTVVNLDTVVVAEEPKISPFVPGMKAVLGPILGLGTEALNVKAKTNEGLGPVGDKRAVACWAVALISKE